MVRVRQRRRFEGLLMEILNPYGSWGEYIPLAIKKAGNRAAGLMSNYPNVFLVNLQNSGSSAIDPILRELFYRRWYFLPPFGPEGSHLIQSIPHSPFYHWSHSSPSQFSSFLGRRDCRFIYLHRDLRDVSVSWAHEMLHRNFIPGASLNELIKLVYQKNLLEPAKAAQEWLSKKCLVIKFEEIKTNLHGSVRLIVDYCGLKNVPDSEIEHLVNKYSYENVTGRKRGEDGPLLRTGYMLRKGISGEWRAHFDNEMKSEFKSIHGRCLIELGYERDLNW